MTYFLLPYPRKQQLRHHCRFAKLSSLSNQGRPSFSSFLFFSFFPDGAVSVRAVIAAAVHLGSVSCSVQLSSSFQVSGFPHTATPLAFLKKRICLFVCLLLFFLYLSLSDVGMLMFQTSVASWERSSVSAGSVTASLPQPLLLHIILLTSSGYFLGGFNCFLFKIFCSHHRHHH